MKIWDPLLPGFISIAFYNHPPPHPAQSHQTNLQRVSAALIYDFLYVIHSSSWSWIVENNHLYIKLLTPNVNYIGRAESLTSKVAFYIFIQQI